MFKKILKTQLIFIGVSLIGPLLGWILFHDNLDYNNKSYSLLMFIPIIWPIICLSGYNFCYTCFFEYSLMLLSNVVLFSFVGLFSLLFAKNWFGLAIIFLTSAILITRAVQPQGVSEFYPLPFLSLVTGLLVYAIPLAYTYIVFKDSSAEVREE